MRRDVTDDGEPRRPLPVEGGAARYEALLHVLEQQNEQAEEARTRAPERRGAGRGRTGMVVVWLLALVSAWLWLFPPGWVGVDRPEPVPVEREEAALRFTMYVQAQRIKAFQQRTGRLPDRLEEAGPPLPGMSYRLLDPSTYELEGATDRVRLSYRSDTALGEFVGPGADVLDETVLP